MAKQKDDKYKKAFQLNANRLLVDRMAEGSGGFPRERTWTGPCGEEG